MTARRRAPGCYIVPFAWDPPPPRKPTIARRQMTGTTSADFAALLRQSLVDDAFVKLYRSEFRGHAPPHGATLHVEHPDLFASIAEAEEAVELAGWGHRLGLEDMAEIEAEWHRLTRRDNPARFYWVHRTTGECRSGRDFVADAEPLQSGFADAMARIGAGG
jgi:hypothetical protein